MRKKSVENIVVKGENAGNQHFLLFQQWFLSYVRHNMWIDRKLSSANVSNLEKAETG